MLLRLESCIRHCVVLFFACLCVGIDLEGSYLVLDVILMLSLMCCFFFLRGFHGDCFGITHPWIGKKWPCTGVAP